MGRLNLGPHQLSDRTSSKSVTQTSETIPGPGQRICLVPGRLCGDGRAELCCACRTLHGPGSRPCPGERGSPGQGDSSSPAGSGVSLRLLPQETKSAKSARGRTPNARTEAQSQTYEAASRWGFRPLVTADPSPSSTPGEGTSHRPQEHASVIRNLAAPPCHFGCGSLQRRV